MRRFGLDIKNKGPIQGDLESGKSKEELDELRARRLARFGEVDPTDLKNPQRKRDKKRTLKFRGGSANRQQSQQQKGNKQRRNK